jgi:hypothetical protein
MGTPLGQTGQSDYPDQTGVLFYGSGVGSNKGINRLPGQQGITESIKPGNLSYRGDERAVKEGS